ncbi:MAG: FAD-dependent oxidoreductase [Armatimonadota bacterium]
MASSQNHLNHEDHEVDVCVVGGGMAGLCAAIASARNGAKTALVQDRPVLGGNASSEVRMWICGAHGRDNKETGILEEIQLENLYRNPALNYSVWDSVLWSKARFQPNLTLFLNCACTDAATDGDTIESIRCWQGTSQTWHTISARQFIDCSGDSILAAVTNAEFRVGREARSEFDEDIEPPTADQKTMGNSLLIQMRRTDESQPYTPPSWAYKFTQPSDLPHRIHGVNATNFWWLEIGGINDTIRDAESIGDELMRIGYGVWDYIKNWAPERAKAENWAIEWIGSLPGKRESRRYVGDHILTQNDVRAGGKFDDIIAFGGWSMDDHHPAGLLYPGKPTLFHPAPSPYGIPYRSLYSRNITNLLFAGRNISVTHAALSSTRVMATCAVIGQAAGTAAALCVRHGVAPRALSSGKLLQDLQNRLMNDDAWLPGKTRPVSDLAQVGTLANRGDGAGESLLTDGVERDRENEPHAWTGSAGGASVEYRWDEAVEIGGVRLVFDSNLNNDKRMGCSYPHKADRIAVPASLIKRFRIEIRLRDGSWTAVRHETNNYARLLRLPLNVTATGLRFVPEETWAGATDKITGAEARVFAFEPVSPGDFKNTLPTLPDGPPFAVVRARVDAKHLAPPENGLEDTGKERGAAA